MFIADQYVLHITARSNLELSIQSNLPFDVVLLAAEWIRETALDIAASQSANFDVIHSMIHDSL